MRAVPYGHEKGYNLEIRGSQGGTEGIPLREDLSIVSGLSWGLKNESPAVDWRSPFD
ncbi:MAG: hypothetical protein ACRC8Y_01710 [Chroococcales cyanobacterium]